MKRRPVSARVNYLNRDYSLRSWLATHDHKRIAILFAFSVTALFFLGGAAAARHAHEGHQ